MSTPQNATARAAHGAARKGSADAEITLSEAAEALGVHYMTAYRYVRTGRLAATQRAGQWRVRRSSLTNIGAPAPPGRVPNGADLTRRHYARRLAAQLVRGDEVEAWRLTQQALAAGCSVEDLYFDVLGPALRRVGDDWAAGRVSVAGEHRASAVTARIVGRLGPLFIRRGRTRGTIVLGAPANDFHGLASALVADVLRGRGFAVADLGANTPAASFAETVAAQSRVVATGIVVSTRLPDAAVKAVVAAIKAATDAPVLIGGTAIRGESHARRLGADATTPSARAAADWFDAVARP